MITPPKKRLLFIDGPLNGGGAERVLIDILNNLDYNKYEVDLALIYKGGELLNQVPPQVNIIGLWKGYSLGYKIAFRLSTIFRCNALLKKKMNSDLLRRDYDAEISFLEGMPLKLGALRTTNAKKITWVHVDLDNYRYEIPQFYPGEEERAYNSMDFVVCVSEQCRESFHNRFKGFNSVSKVIYNLVDVHRVKTLADDYDVETAPSDIVNVVCVGRLDVQKNPFRLIEIAAHAKADNLPVRFTWVGDGNLRAELEERCHTEGLDNMIQWVGFRVNPYPYIKAADIMLVPSDAEGFCLVIVEAMCLGVPVISTRTVGPTEIIGDNEYGILTDLNADEMYSRLKEFVKSPDKRRNLADKASKRPDDYSVAHTIQKFNALIN